MISDLRKRYPSFIYQSFRVLHKNRDLIISYSFKIEPDIKFNPKILIHGVTNKLFKKLDKKIIDNFAFNLGLIEMLSYWKATCSPKMLIQAGYLDDYQANWWKDILLRGMGQFFYENKIDYRTKNFVNIYSDSVPNLESELGKVQGNRTLVPVGGGKDSTVTLEILTREFSNIGAFALNPTKSSLDVIRLSGVDEVIRVDRTIDKKLFELNAKGFLNGHTPFSAYLAFLSTFVGYLYGYKNIAFSNERSADEGNIKYLEREINHQYSKTFDFENKFREYNQKYISNINYLSFLRPLYEIQIAKLFSRMDKYFSAIRSCNVGQKTNSWCCSCAKCLSTFILLYPFLGLGKILKIFPQNLFENKGLLPVLEALISEDKVKPFECVGTREEVKVALFLSIKKTKRLPYLLGIAKRNFLQEDLEKKTEAILGDWGEENNLGKKFETILRKKL